jgi:hypothetical protein
MSDRVKELGKVIIEKSFPLLRGKKIHFIIFPFKFFALSLWIPLVARVVVISTRTKYLKDEVITGILAHELCHQERYLQMGVWRYLSFVVKYTFSNKARTLEERATDTLTIDKGYGRNLYELTFISHNDKNHKSILDNYLTPDEIKTYAESIGKW